jgi:hypothetical protein
MTTAEQLKGSRMLKEYLVQACDQFILKKVR